MIVWGGQDANFVFLNTGGRYNPLTNSWTATSTTNAPPTRTGHTAVWTGSEMIVYGGYYLTTGGRYNPSTDSWTATSTTNAPAGRVGHTGAWTGNEMIIWGGLGCDGSCNLNTGGRYNPSTDSWKATSTTNAPSARRAHTAVWTDTEMIVWGGFDFDGNELNTGGRYNPSTDSWVATNNTNAPEARAGHNAVWTGGEMIVWGGENENFSDVNTGGRYNPSTGSWTATSVTNAPSARKAYTVVWSGSEMIVWGGCTSTGIHFCDTSLNTGGRYCAPPPVAFTLGARGRKVGGINTVRLT